MLMKCLELQDLRTQATIMNHFVNKLTFIVKTKINILMVSRKYFLLLY